MINLVAFLVVVLYFGILNSRFFQGQTLGQKLLKICVVDKNGQFISPQCSFNRASIFALPLLLECFSYASPLIEVFSILLYLGFIYFYLFNRNTRQSLHDLATKTFIVNKSGVNEPVGEIIWRKHFVIYAAVALLTTIGAFAAQSGGDVPKEFKANSQAVYENLQKELMVLDGVSDVRISEMVWRKSNIFTGESDDPDFPRKILHIDIYTDVPDQADMAKRATGVINKYSMPDGIQGIKMKIISAQRAGILATSKSTVINIEPNRQSGENNTGDAP